MNPKEIYKLRKKQSEMQKEMELAGLIQDSFDDAIDETYDGVGDVEVEKEIDTVIKEVTGKTLSEIQVVNTKFPTTNIQRRVDELINQE